MPINRIFRPLMLTCLLVGLAGTASAQQDMSQDNVGYVGPMGPNVGKAFGVDQMQPAMAPAPMMPAAPHSHSGVISDPQQIRDCLCMQTRYEMLGNNVSTKQAAYSQATSQVSSLNDQIAAARANPSSPQQIDQIRQLSSQRIETQNKLDMQYIPELQSATQTYNQAVQSFDQMCGSRSYDTEVLGRVKTGLVCQGG